MRDGLTPDVESLDSVAVEQELPPVARQWGRILKTSGLLPGDLVLVRSMKPDRTSRAIHQAQTDGGFPERHAQWTHAAVYLGDDEHVCEANVKEENVRWGVDMRSIFHYCDGVHALKVRRPIVRNERQRIRIVIGALLHVGKRYSLLEVLSFAKAAASGKGFWQNGRKRRIRPRALVCSTLYQDAYNYSFTGTTVRMGSLCTPAHLSSSRDLEDVDDIGWLNLA